MKYLLIAVVLFGLKVKAQVITGAAMTLESTGFTYMYKNKGYLELITYEKSLKKDTIVIDSMNAIRALLKSINNRDKEFDDILKDYWKTLDENKQLKELLFLPTFSNLQFKTAKRKARYYALLKKFGYKEITIKNK